MMGSIKEPAILESIRTHEVSKQETVTTGTQVNAHLEFERRGGKNKPDQWGHYRTNASNIYFTYPLKLMLPTHASSSHCQWVYSINYGGGIVSGDNVEVCVDVREDCCAMLTTQASTKVYHSEDGETSRQRVEGRVAAGSVLAVLQDPVTCFAGARYRQFQTFHMEKDSSLVYMDWLSAGRIARGERWDFFSYYSCNSVFYDGAIVLRDAVSLENTPLLDIKQTMGGYDVVASCVLLGEKFSEVSRHAILKYGASQDYGINPNPEMVVSVSPLKKAVGGEEILGAIIKFASVSVNKVYEQVEEILLPVFPMLGGNPFAEKH